MANKIMVKLADLARAGICRKGAKRWALSQGIDWEKFRKEGLPIEDFESWGHACSDRVARLVRERNGGGE